MIQGLHHVTAIAGDPQRNLDFYVGLLGLRLVKRTINFDDPVDLPFLLRGRCRYAGDNSNFLPLACGATRKPWRR